MIFTCCIYQNYYYYRHFSEVNNEATDEVWYKRAVEYHYNNPDSFVFSVPFDIGDKRPTTVTATHAIYKEMNGKKAPAAVVGVQIDYDKFAQNFMDVTTGLGGVGYKVLRSYRTPIYVPLYFRPNLEIRSLARTRPLNAMFWITMASSPSLKIPVILASSLERLMEPS